MGPHSNTVSIAFFSTQPLTYKYNGHETFCLFVASANILYYDNNNQRESNPEVHQNGAAFVVNQLSRAWFTHEIASTWWNYHWLNDGFAKYLEYLIGSQVFISYVLLP